MNTNRLLQTLERHEGYRRHPYICTAGKTSVAIGRNLDDVGIRYSEALIMLKNDLGECRLDLKQIFRSFDDYSDHVQEVLMNMRFQLGARGFRGFKKMIDAVKGLDFDLAAKEGLDSRWAKQTPDRAKELMEVLRSGRPNFV